MVYIVGSSLPNVYRKDFPIFACKQDTVVPFVYLDNAATTQKTRAVIDRLVDFYTRYNANVHRGEHALTEESTRQYEHVRMQVKQFINAKQEKEIVFTSGATDGLNLIAASWAKQHILPGDEILMSIAEHHANFLPWGRIAEQAGATVRLLKPDKDHFYFIHPEREITSRTKLVAITYHSNLLGSMWQSDDDLKNFIACAHAVGAKVVLDATQCMIHKRIDVQMLDVDFLVFSGHKMFAPTGCGVVYINDRLHNELKPYKVGGAMVDAVSESSVTWAVMPHLLEAGTPSISSVLGLGTAIDYIDALDFAQIRTYEAALCSKLIDFLEQSDEFVVVGNVDFIRKNGHMVTFLLKNCDPHEIADLLSKNGVFVRVGYMCAHPFALLLGGGESLIRVSVAMYNTIEDIDHLCVQLGALVASSRENYSPKG